MPGTWKKFTIYVAKCSAAVIQLFCHRRASSPVYERSNNLLVELGEVYGIIAYGDAATVCLDIATKPMPHLAALVCYYPTHIPAPKAKYPTSLNIVTHVAASQGFAPKFKYYSYDGVDPGFAEHDCDEYDRVSADLAWSRSLAAVRKGFKREVDLEEAWEQHASLKYQQKDAAATVGTMNPDANVAYIPTLTGASGQRALYRFYKNFFMPSIPPTLRMRLLSRTLGTDRVVDEMLVSFRHDREIPWILPNTPATNKNVEIALVSIVAIKGGQLVHEHVYWDQASVLVQVGLLDPNVVPGHMRKQGMQRLPVVGVEGARKLVTPQAIETNGLLPKWKEAEAAGRSVSIQSARKGGAQNNDRQPSGANGFNGVNANGRQLPDRTG